MMMISLSKLRKAQRLISGLSPYQQKLNEILQIFLSTSEELASPYFEKREVKNISIVAFSSNNSLAGRFNDNVIDELSKTIQNYRKEGLGKENIKVYAIGDKVRKAALKMNVTLDDEDFKALSEKPSYAPIQAIAEEISKDFINGKIDKAEIIYQHFKSKSVQIVTHEDFLPITVIQNKRIQYLDYIIEPKVEILLNRILPKVLDIQLYTAHADSVAAEHAARVMAMQTATDNAQNLTDELTLLYNKLRQQGITTELLDMVGGQLGNER